MADYFINSVFLSNHPQQVVSKTRSIPGSVFSTSQAFKYTVVHSVLLQILKCDGYCDKWQALISCCSSSFSFTRLLTFLCWKGKSTVWKRRWLFTCYLLYVIGIYVSSTHTKKGSNWWNLGFMTVAFNGREKTILPEKTDGCNHLRWGDSRKLATYNNPCWVNKSQVRVPLRMLFYGKDSHFQHRVKSSLSSPRREMQRATRVVWLTKKNGENRNCRCKTPCCGVCCWHAGWVCSMCDVRGDQASE